MAERELNILLTNDDGVNAEGLICLQRELRTLGKVITVAPHQEKSGASHSISLNQAFQIAEISENRYALKGSPADCVMFAIKKMLESPPDLVVSGINHGANLGDDVVYSGTVAGAREGALSGILSFAISQTGLPSDETLNRAACFSTKLISRIISYQPPAGSLFNINIPDSNPSSFRFTKQSSKKFKGNIEEFIERGQGRVYRVVRGEEEWTPEPNTDLEAIGEGVVSVTPLQFDQTDYRTAEYLIRKHLKKEPPRK